jgi:hypothetical protein
VPAVGDIAIGNGTNGAGTGGQISCSVTQGGHYNNPSVAGSTTGSVVCLYFREDAGGGSDTLAGLSCDTNEFPKWTGTAWACASDGGGSGSAEVAGDAGQIQFNDGSDAFAADANLNWDNTNKRLGIGVSTPESALHMRASVSTESNIVFETYLGVSPSSGGILWKKARGTPDTPLAVQANDYLFNVGARGYGDTGFGPVSRVNMGFLSEEDWTDTAQGTYIRFDTTPLGSSARTEKMRITADGNVGIGTTAPVAPLEINTATNTATSRLRLKNDIDSSIDLRVYGSADIGSVIGITPRANWANLTAYGANAQGLMVSTEGARPIAFGNDATERMRISDNGNVGIGTTTPQSSLQVVGGIQLGDDNAACPGSSNAKLGTLRFNSETLEVCTSGGWDGTDAGGEAEAAGDVGQIQFNDGSDGLAADTEFYWDDANNRLGIGTAAPATRLHIGGSGSIIRLDDAALGASAIANGMSGVEPLAGGMNAASNLYTPAIKFGSTDPQFTTTNPKILAGLVGRATQTYLSDTKSGMALDFFTTGLDAGASPTPSTRMTILDNGHVGIGTIAPTEQLSVFSSDPVRTSVVAENDTGDAVFWAHATAADKDAFLLLRTKDGSTAHYWYLSSDGSDDNKLKIGQTTSVGSNAALTVSKAGNVGVGTASPADRLVVSSPSAADTKLEINAGGNQYAALRVKNSQQSFIWQVTPTADAPAGRLRLYKEAPSAGEFLTILPSGNIGIGSATPSSKLEVRGNVASLSEGGTPAFIGYGYGDQGGHFIGYLARGTVTSPTQPQSGDVLASFQGRTAIGGAVWPGMTVYAAENQTSTAQGTLLSFTTSATGGLVTSERMRILANGNVGIGTTSPAQKLSVSGMIESTAGGFKFPDGTTQTTAATAASMFSRITATVTATTGGNWSYSGYVACPAGYTLINYGMQDFQSAGGWPEGSGNAAYANCQASGDSVRAAHWSGTANSSFRTTCFGLCLKN